MAEMHPVHSTRYLTFLHDYIAVPIVFDKEHVFMQSEPDQPVFVVISVFCLHVD